MPCFPGLEPDDAGATDGAPRATVAVTPCSRRVDGVATGPTGAQETP